MWLFLWSSNIGPHAYPHRVCCQGTHLFNVVKLLLHLMVDSLGLDQLLLDSKRCQITSSQSTMVRLNSIYCGETIAVEVFKPDGKIDR